MHTFPRFHLTLFAVAALAGCTGSESPDATPDAGTRPPPTSPNEDGWWRDAVGYEIFVRSFADSDADGIGDFPGLIDHLDYLNDGDPSTDDDLGVDAIWLMPIHPSPSYHGYDITDYRDIQPEYGTLEDFDAFVEAAQARGMRVILDLVLNHSSELHPWFQDAQTGPDAEFRDYYKWSDENPGWRRPWDRREVWYELNGDYYYGLFGDDIPDLDLSNPAVEEEIFEIMRFWAARGVDGFRVDAARHLFESEDGDVSDQPETHAFIQRIRERLHAEHPDVLLLAEAWINVETLKAYYGDGYEYQLAFSFDVAAGIKAAASTGDTTSLADVLERSAAAYPDRGFEAPFLSNHDQDRVVKTMDGDLAKARLSAAALMAMPGTPFLYYGEELGMRGGGTPFDQDKRQPFRWTSEAPGFGFTEAAETWHRSSEEPGVDVAAQRGVPGSMWSLYRDLIALRHAHPALAEGDQTVVPVSGGSGLLAWTREEGDERVLFVANFADADASGISVDVSGAPSLLSGEGVDAATVAGGGPVTLSGLPAKGWAYIALE